MKHDRFDVSFSDIQKAQRELSKHIKPTPLLLNSALSDRMGCEVWLKLENMHPIGSFKIRGATYRISQLSGAERKRGVIAASAGNHAQGVAWGSRKLGVSATIVMPRSAPLIKIQNTRALGAEIIFEGETYDEAFEAAKRHARKSGRVFIHAFEDPLVIAGQGTTGLEILEDLPDADAIITSIGGGGLLAGIAKVVQELRPKTALIGCQSSGAPSMVRSIRKGRAIKLDRVDTFADGIAVARASEKMRKLLTPIVDRFVEADDEAIAGAVLMLMEKAKLVVEGSGALPLAVLEKIRGSFKRKKVVLVLSGGNIDVNLISRIIDLGLIRSGRRLRLNVFISDRPGSLAHLTNAIAKAGASVIQAIHDRSEPSVSIDQTEVFLTLETKGAEHSREIIRVLRDQVERLDIVR